MSYFVDVLDYDLCARNPDTFIEECQELLLSNGKDVNLCDGAQRLGCLGISIENDEEGIIYFYDACFQFDNSGVFLLDRFAKLLEPGNYIDFRGEDGDYFRIFYDDDKTVYKTLLLAPEREVVKDGVLKACLDERGNLIGVFSQWELPENVLDSKTLDKAHFVEIKLNSRIENGGIE